MGLQFALRNSTFLRFSFSQKLPLINSIIGSLPPVGSEVVNICCPFGATSKELFFLLEYKGIIANYLTENLGVLDIEASEALLNTEGSPVMN
jgi:hypothetical protein